MGRRRRSSGGVKLGGLSGSFRIVRTVRIVRLSFPDAGADLVVGEGVDVETRERVHFIVPPDHRLSVLADAHAGRHPLLTLHPFDIVPWGEVLGMV